jgi:hypothetical protein
MTQTDRLLTHAELRHRDADPVGRKQQELRPVREGLLQRKADFLKGVTRLQPRLDAAARAVDRLNRLAAQTGRQLGYELIHLSRELDHLIRGIPGSYDVAIGEIDRLTPADLAQHRVMVTLEQKLAWSPGDIGNIQAILGRLETALEAMAARYAELSLADLPQSGSGPVASPDVAPPAERGPDPGPQVESEFRV